MPSAKNSTRKQGKKRQQVGKDQSQSSSRRSKVATNTQDTIAIPELTARLAALEHLLIEKQICSHEDLVRSREFVDIRQKLQ